MTEPQHKRGPIEWLAWLVDYVVTAVIVLVTNDRERMNG